MSEWDDQPDIPSEGPKRCLQWTVTLLSFSAIGLSGEIVQCFPPTVNVPSLVLVASWVRFLVNMDLGLGYSPLSRQQYAF
jgi:hypothetical protein